MILPSSVTQQSLQIGSSFVLLVILLLIFVKSFSLSTDLTKSDQ